MSSTLNTEHIEQILDDTDATQQAERAMQCVMNLRGGEYNRARTILYGLGADEYVGEHVAQSRRRFFDVLDHEEHMHGDVERGRGQFGIINMRNVEAHGNSRASHRPSELGWGFTPQLLDLDGTLDMSVGGASHSNIYFLESGEVEVTIEDGEPVKMAPNAQIAVPAGVRFSIKGKGSLFILHMHADAMAGLEPETIIGNFDDIREGEPQVEPFRGEKIQCPCGPSRRMKLIEHGWNASTHLTTMGVHVDGKVHHFEKGHQHFTTQEAYYIARIQYGKPIMTIDGMEFPLEEGQLILVPTGVMHEIEGGKVDVRILVVGGHDDGDFRQRNWRHVREKNTA